MLLSFTVLFQVQSNVQSLLLLQLNSWVLGIFRSFLKKISEQVISLHLTTLSFKKLTSFHSSEVDC